MVFPKNNLPATAAPWGREVEKQLTNVATSIKSNETNNAARDNQLASTMSRLNTNVAAIKTITDSVFTLNTDVSNLETNIYVTGTTEINGYNIKAGTINANSVNAGTFQTAYSGRRVVMSGTANSIYFHDVNGDQVGYMNGGGVGREGEFIITGPATNYNISFGSTNTLISGAGKSIEFNSQGIILSGDTYNLRANGDNISGNTSSSQGPLVVIDTSGNYMKFDGNEISQYGSSLYLNGTGASGNVVAGAGGGNLNVRNSLTVGTAGTIVLDNGGAMYPTNPTPATGTANVRQAGSGTQLIRVSSARRYKFDIQDVDYGLKALNLRPRTWVDKYEYEQNGNSVEGLHRVPGFVAEEVQEAGLDELLTYDYETGELAGLSYDRMLGAVIPVIKYQHEQIQLLINRIEQLEGK